MRQFQWLNWARILARRIRHLWRRRYVFLAPAAIWRSRRALGSESARERQTVVFVTLSVGVRQAKMAAALRRVGWRVILLYQGANLDVRRYCDEARHCGSEWQALWLASAYRPEVFHVFTSHSDRFAETLVRYKPGPVVYDSYDMIEGSGLPQRSERILGQLYCLQHADALCCRDLQMQELCRRHGLTRPRALYFPEYSWGPSSEPRADWQPGQPIHVVSVGMFGLESLGYHQHGYLKLSRMLTSQGIHVHVYERGTPPNLPFEVVWADYLRLAQESPYFHLHRSVPADRLHRELRDYHVGISAILAMTWGEPITEFGEPHLRFGGSSRMFDYLDAGLPILLNRGLWHQYRLLARYGLVIDPTPAFLDDAAQRLSEFLSQDVQRRVRRAQETLDVHRQISRLIAFYSQVPGLAQRGPCR